MTENIVPLFQPDPPPPPPGTDPPLTVVPGGGSAPPPAWVRCGRAVRWAATHEHTRTAGRLTVRHSLYVAGGARVLARRAWEGRSASRYERMIRAAEAAGNTELAAEWEERGARFRAARHMRRMELLTAPQRAAKGLAAGAATGAAVLLAVGALLALATGEVADVIAPAMAVVSLVYWLTVLLAVVWGPLWVAAPWLVLLSLWSVGRRRQTAPQWALPATQRTAEGPPITPSIVVTALRDLGIAALRTAIRDMGDAGAAMLGPIRIAGCGVEVDATLPSGVTTEEVMTRRRKLAENLGRHEHEVYISIAPAARTVRVWIADSGALDEPVPASPLALDTTLRADYKSGRAPWGLDLRGDQAAVSLYQRHLLVTGLSNQGKTASLRALALWLILDPTVEFRIADLKGVGDWNMFDGLAHTLIQGPTDDHVAEATEMVEGIFAEMQRRLLAPAGTVFPPLVAVVDEAQVAYGCGAIGADKRPYGGSKATSRYFQAVKGIHDQGRAVNVTIWEGTQDPTNENLPKRSREGNHIRASLALGTESQAQMALGEAPVQAGAAPHKLRQGLDRGQLVVAGDGLQLAAGQTFTNVRTHFINDDDARAITDRARQLRTTIETSADADEHDEPDDLAAIGNALGNEPRMRTQEVLQRLAQANPRRYRDWTFASLKAVLDPADAAPYKSNGHMVVSRDKITAALDARDDDTANGDAA
ncbi:ATP-binding protein [Streptomyces sp. JJ66]|uniref:ATP-binding protein n=1 Tax=Streptomyces sp. JJ66 TaxID=2803843 RepID=UPI001C56348B|nr:ATP-binding protein [Streptomyces sp. JJ66]MBW1601783.1 ATP-binding protein [Streptomyces sp. JJ66]